MRVEVGFFGTSDGLLESRECVCTLESTRHEHRILFGVQRHQQHGDRTHPAPLALAVSPWAYGARNDAPARSRSQQGEPSREIGPPATTEITQCDCPIFASEPLQESSESPPATKIGEVGVGLDRDRPRPSQQRLTIPCELLCRLTLVVQLFGLDVFGFEVAFYPHEVGVPVSRFRHARRYHRTKDRLKRSQSHRTRGRPAAVIRRTSVPASDASHVRRRRTARPSRTVTRGGVRATMRP